MEVFEQRENVRYNETRNDYDYRYSCVKVDYSIIYDEDVDDGDNGREVLVFQTEWLPNKYEANYVYRKKYNEIFFPEKVTDVKTKRDDEEEVEIHPYRESYDGSIFRYRNCLQ